MVNYPESKPCVQCDGFMDRRHGTLPLAQTPLLDARRIANAQASEVGTYYRCLKNGAHTVIVARDVKVPPVR